MEDIGRDPFDIQMQSGDWEAGARRGLSHINMSLSGPSFHQQEEALNTRWSSV